MTKELEKALRHIKTRADAWAVKEIEKALSQQPFPDNATNGEVIKILFADFMYVPWKEWLMIDLPWWNAPYQKGGK